VALAEVAGHIVMRTADAEVLPMRFGDFSDTLDRYVKELHKLVDNTRKATEKQHKLMAMHAYELDSDPTRPVAPPERDSDVPKIDLAPLDQAAKALKQSAKAYESAYEARAANGLRIPADQLRRINDLMARMEQSLTDKDGLPGREWFRHMIYAPGLLTGYGVKTVPGVREALEARRWDQANKYAAVTAKVLDGYRAQLDKLTAMLK
jgi:N-acetylated-alpha-linked acidic dipeptidase